MALQDEAREITLQRGKVEATAGIALKDELQQAVAEPANAVVENDWIRHGVYLARGQEPASWLAAIGC